MLENNQNMELVLLEDLGMMYPTEKSKDKRRFGLYKCFCGNEFKAQTSSIKNGHTKSCGCYIIKSAKESKTTHGLFKHRLYNTWLQMMHRCNNPKYKNFKHYGGRGITVSERWKDVRNFIEDMDLSYTKGLSIDRIDVNGNYCKDNCRWATKSVQARNTRILIKTNTSGYRGVSFKKKNKNFQVQISVNNKLIHIGCFNSAIEGAKAYNKYVIENNLEHTLNLV